MQSIYAAIVLSDSALMSLETPLLSYTMETFRKTDRIGQNTFNLGQKWPANRKLLTIIDLEDRDTIIVGNAFVGGLGSMTGIGKEESHSKTSVICEAFYFRGID